MSKLTFSALRVANMRRLPLFRNGKGEIAHSQPDGSDWSPSEWMNAVLGELGEAANLIKKVRRGDFALDDYVYDGTNPLGTMRSLIAKELADTVTYLDILAYQFGIDLGEAVRLKFNEISRRVGTDVLINDDGHVLVNSAGETK